MKLNLGSGHKKLDGYVNLDVRGECEPDVVCDVCDLSRFGGNSVEEVRGDALYEHVWPHMRQQALAEWYRVLAPGGLLVLQWIPDFVSIIGLWVAGKFDLEMVRRQLYGAAPEDTPSLHKDIFWREKIESELMVAGFESIQVYEIAEENMPSYNLIVTARKPNVPAG